MDQTELREAIVARHAVRRYADKPIPKEVRSLLDQEIARCNAESGLSIQALYDDAGTFEGLLPHYGQFRGVRNRLAMVGPEGVDADIACGYYGEQVVLLAQHLGLNSCWVGLTYSKRRVGAQITPGERLRVVVALGYGLAPGKQHRSKPLTALGRVEGGGEWPDWFRDGVELASLAPTGLNRQNFMFVLDGEEVRTQAGIDKYSRIDLGIAKFHFEVGAGQGPWRWG